MTKIRIETFSDTTCIFCLMGKLYLDKAMDDYRTLHPEVEFEITWNPIYLNPCLKVSEMTKLEYCISKYGADSIDGLIRRLAIEGEPLGLKVSLEGRFGPSNESHALLLLAQHRAKEAAMCQATHNNNNNNNSNPKDSNTFGRLADRFFRGGLEQGADISDRKFLAGAAVAEGLFEDEEDALDWLSVPGRTREADELDQRAKKEVGITAVPSYIIQDRYRIGGKQEPEVFAQVFDRIRAAASDD